MLHSSSPSMESPSPPELLSSLLSRYQHLPVPDNRPLVTLTFAQSLDAKIAGQHGRQLILSGKESMVMTHWMRTMHDAILVGIGTAINDDPQLNVRHLPRLSGQARHHLPRPVIVDSRLRLPPTCKLLTNYQNGSGRRPWVVSIASNDSGWCDRLGRLENAGARVIQLTIPEGEQMSVHDILLVLRRNGVRTLMVEGGAKVVASFFAQSPSGRPVIDSLIVTVAPTLVGAEGVGYGVDVCSGMSSKMEYARTDQLGTDTIVAFTARV